MRVTNLCRDQIKNFASGPQQRFISTDFNDDGLEKNTSGLEIVVPNDLSMFDIDSCKEYIAATYDLLRLNGKSVPIRYDDGIKKGGGVPGVIHTEPFFADDVESTMIIIENAKTYAFIMAQTLGRIKNAHFILPHKTTDPGAMNALGMSEREFARYVIMPHLMKMYSPTGYNHKYHYEMGQPQVMIAEINNVDSTQQS